MANNPISEKVLREILSAYVAAEERMLSEDALRELAAGAGKSEQAVKNDYTRLYHQAGGEGDPWDLPPAILRPDDD